MHVVLPVKVEGPQVKVIPEGLQNGRLGSVALQLGFFSVPRELTGRRDQSEKAVLIKLGPEAGRLPFVLVDN